MSESMTVLVPSRGRPQNIHRLMAAWEETEAEANLVVCIDDDDPALQTYGLLDPGPNMDIVVGPRLRLGGTLNDLAPQYAQTCSVIGFMGDDHCPRTKYWDQLLLGVHEGLPLAVSYGDDLLQGERLATAAFLDSKIVNTLGYMVFPGGTHLYFDDFWMSLGRALTTLRYVPEVIIEHLHPHAGKAPHDDQYTEVNSDVMYEHDRLLYQEYMAYEMPNAIAKLRAL